MFGRLSFGRIGGIPITASRGWIVVVGILIWVVANHLGEISDVSVTASVLLASLAVALFFGSIVAHELGHAIVARRAGLRVDGIELWMIGGFTRLREAPRSPGEQFRVAVAGPVVTFVLTVVLLGGASLLAPGSPTALADGDPRQVDPVTAIAVLLGLLNLFTLILNLLPAYPLDGGLIVRAIAWRITGDPHRATRYAAIAGMTLGGLTVAAGTFVLLSSGSTADGLAIALIGWLMTISARASVDSARAQERLDAVTVGAIADPSVSAVDGHHTVLSATEGGGPPGAWVVVRMGEGRLPALLSAAAIGEALGKGQPALTLAELAADEADRTIDGDTSLREVVIDPRLRDGGPLLALGTEGQALGLVTGSGLQRAIALPPRSR